MVREHTRHVRCTMIGNGDWPALRLWWAVSSRNMMVLRCSSARFLTGHCAHAMIITSRLSSVSSSRSGTPEILRCNAGPKMARIFEPSAVIEQTTRDRPACAVSCGMLRMCVWVQRATAGAHPVDWERQGRRASSMGEPFVDAPVRLATMRWQNVQSATHCREAPTLGSLTLAHWA
jgi:hypothetical protein